MEVGIQCREYGVGLLPGARVVNGFRGGGVETARQNWPKSSSCKLRLISNYVGLRAEPTTSGVASSPSAPRSLNAEQCQCRPRRAHSGRRSISWIAKGGIQLPNPSVFWDGVKNPLLQSMQDRGLFVSKKQPEVVENPEAGAETRFYFADGRTFNPTFPNGELSNAAIDCIEQFSRLNGITGKKTQTNFESSTSAMIQKDPRNLVEFASFRYLARCISDFHPSLKDASFRRLTFSAMLAWQRPYQDGILQNGTTISNGLPGIGRVGEKAFGRIAPAIAGVADRPTAHGLYQALVGDNGSLSFDRWDLYCSELCKEGVQVELAKDFLSRAHLMAVDKNRDVKGREQQLDHEGARLGLEEGERIVRVLSDTRQPVQKWNKTNAWPGRLTLTDHALYFEANGLGGHQKATRLDLSGSKVSVEKKMVGPFGVEVFDSAISVSSDPESEPWILDFVDFSGEGRRDIFLASIKEIFAAYAFIAEYGVKQDDALVKYIYGAKHGQKKVLSAAARGIARLQAVQTVVGKLLAHPERLLQFSYLANAPSGDLVLQALAVAFWGGRMEVNSREIGNLANLAMGGTESASEEAGGLGSNMVGTDGSVYLRRWATSPSWSSGKSGAFWRARGGKGLVLGKNHVVGGLTQVERAVQACRDQTILAEKTQATIEGALLKGIPDNVDLLKELFLPFTVAAVNLEKLRRWDNPGASAAFLFFVYGIIYMNWVRYVIPSLLLSGAAGILTLRVLNGRGRLRSDFGKVTIREQPPSNTIQQIIALKEALSALEDFLQNCNIALLKLRSVFLSREPRVTNEVLMALFGLGVAMIVVPFRYLLAMFIFDQFTNTLKFRENSLKEMFKYLRDWWNTIPAAPVVVLPPEKQEGVDEKLEKSLPTKGEAIMQAMSEWIGEDNELIQLPGGTD